MIYLLLLLLEVSKESVEWKRKQTNKEKIFNENSAIQFSCFFKTVSQ